MIEVCLDNDLIVPVSYLEASQKVRNLHAMKRWGEPNEISSAVLYLASEEASFCTGTNLIVDGGWTAGKDW